MVDAFELIGPIAIIPGWKLSELHEFNDLSESNSPKCVNSSGRGAADAWDGLEGVPRESELN